MVVKAKKERVLKKPFRKIKKYTKQKKAKEKQRCLKCGRLGDDLVYIETDRFGNRLYVCKDCEVSIRIFENTRKRMELKKIRKGE